MPNKSINMPIFSRGIFRTKYIGVLHSKSSIETHIYFGALQKRNLSLQENHSFALLKEYSIPTPKTILAKTPEEAYSATLEIGVYHSNYIHLKVSNGNILF